MTDSNSLSGTIALGKRGKWGGLILLGDAPSSNYKQKSIEGIDSAKGGYGGIDPNHNGGVLTYVRVWHGGAVVGADNEINGITFGAVGSGTTVHHCEVARSVGISYANCGSARKEPARFSAPSLPRKLC